MLATRSVPFDPSSRCGRCESSSILERRRHVAHRLTAQPIALSQLPGGESGEAWNSRRIGCAHVSGAHFSRTTQGKNIHYQYLKLDPSCDLGYDPAVARRDRRPKGTGAEDEVQTERDGDRDRAQWRCRWIGCQRQWGQCGQQVQSRKRPGSSQRSNTQQLTITVTLRVQPNALVPVGSRFKGHRDFVVQDLRIEPHNIR